MLKPSNDPTRAGGITMVLHRQISVTIFALLALGIAMNGLLDALPVKAPPSLHPSLGVTVSLLVLMRIAVRLAVTWPATADATVATRRRAHDAGFFIRRDGRAATPEAMHLRNHAS